MTNRFPPGPGGQERGPQTPSEDAQQRRRKARGQGGAFGGGGRNRPQNPAERRDSAPRRAQQAYAGHVVEQSLAGAHVNHTRHIMFMAMVMLVTLPGLYFRFIVGGNHGGLPPVVAAAIFGLAVVGASFIVSWAAEAAEMDISRGLAISFLALIAVLPEYAVDMYLAWKAGAEAAIGGPLATHYSSLATANMTGANRLLIGVAWSMVVFIFWYRTRQKVMEIKDELSVELVFLTIATLYAFTLPLKGSITLLDTVVFVALFVWYMIVVARSHSEEPDLVGPALTVALMPQTQRRITVVGLFIFAAAVILSSAEPFAESLIDAGRESGISEFLLIQWLAPLASESPEVIVAFLFAWRGHALKGMAALVSSKVNQWTLLIGTLPLVYSIAYGGIGSIHLDAVQIEEIALTAAQSFFGIAVLANLRVSVWEALVLFALFISQLFLSDPNIRLAYSGLYIVLALGLLIKDRRRVGYMLAFGSTLLRGRSAH
ncbi:MAG: hypothetical protein NTZ05_23110 [Chloroflexi bacterium]|nr:hypothetical protein [Chloroflexota bacterium]